MSGVDNYSRRSWLKERGFHTVIPVSRITERLHAAKEGSYFTEDMVARNKKEGGKIRTA